MHRIDVTAGEQGQEVSSDEPIIAEGEDGVTEQSEGAEGAEGAEENHDEPGEDDQHKLPEKIQKQVDKRIGKEVAKRKVLEERATQAETELKALRERVDADDADTVLQAASEFNVLPEVIGKGQAQGMLDLRRAKQNVKALGRALEETDGDEIILQGKTYDRKSVKKALFDYRDEVERLEPKFGHLEHEAKKAMLEIVRLGQAAKRAGWKPGQKAAAETPTAVKPKPEAARKPEEDDDKPPARVRKAEGSERSREQDSGGRREGESLADYFDRIDKDKAKQRH
jgi:hypothetical protein